LPSNSLENYNDLSEQTRYKSAEHAPFKNSETLASKRFEAERVKK